jgi:hypothetical protein
MEDDSEDSHSTLRCDECRRIVDGLLRRGLHPQDADRLIEELNRHVEDARRPDSLGGL